MNGIKAMEMNQKKIFFRGEELIDRVDEKNYILDYFSKLPKEILWIYGPKSTGKTTIIEYIVENELFENFELFKSSKYNVKYINFRGLLIGCYNNFIDALLEEKDDEEIELKRVYSLLGVFRLEAKTLKKIRENKKNLFVYLIDEFKKNKKRNILIIDEIQTLDNIYINGKKELIHEFLNFCVRLTKETHLSHVVIISSNTIFINKVYNNAKLKVTSKFYKIDHLDFNIVKEWLGELDFAIQDIKLIYDYFGGSIAHIQRALREIEWQKHKSLNEILDEMASLAKSEIVMTFRELRKLKKRNSKEMLKQVSSHILRSGYYELEKEIVETDLEEEFDFVIDYFCDKEILFFEPSNNKIYANSRIYEKAFEML